MAHVNHFPNINEVQTGTEVTDFGGADKACADVFVRNDASNPIFIDGAISAASPSVGATGANVPAQADFLGLEDPSGDLIGAKASASGELLVSSATLALEATLQDVLTDTTALVAKDFATQTTLSALNTKVPANLTVTATRLLVDGSGVTQPVSGPLTDAQLRASAVPVSGPLTDAELRASAVPVSAAALPLPTGAATESTLAAASAKLPATLGQKASAASLAVVIASDQSGIPVTTSANTATYDEIVNLTTSAQTFTAPAKAVGFLIQASGANAENIRFKAGAVATTTSGMILEPGRSESLQAGSNVSVIAAAGTNQEVYIQWEVAP